MKKKKLPKRQCVGCKEMKEKRHLIRVVKQKDKDEYSIDKTGKISGRGAYICDSKDCLELAIKNKGFHRSFKDNISDDIYKELVDQINHDI